MAKKKTKQRKSNVIPQPLTPEISPKIDYHRPSSSKRYGIPAHFLRNYPKLAPARLGLSTFILSHVDEDVGHTVVHFLYTGGYETVSSPLSGCPSDLAREYKRSVLVYHASRTWGLTDLEVLAQQKMQHFDNELSIIEILRVMRDVFSSLPAGETWLPSYIQENLQRQLKPNDPGLGLREFYDIIGQDHQFDNAVMKLIIEILSMRIFSMKDQREEPEPVPEEPEPVPEEPEPVPEEPEPVPEEPEPVPEEPEPVPEEPEPTESLIEEPEPVPEETPAEGNSEQWTIPQVPANADGWPRASLLPGGTPDTELLQETPDQGHIARISCSDLNLYENWGSLSSKRRAIRASKLRSRGLPVPSETGFISIVAD
ncbi:hypothetical protein N7533_003487 [Penicillium manginii]|uniref:uncharacterized protein n=1 Tax=Penicillium manginii TaxID=203109 RepID=UPI0025497999|nr:uncharacterized protein N7533_003487 [Penicillium manginii]KAJ5761448.1 hypothetical protein N7533_003487 [Penicillium manginii]